jgi:hypothetical protein
LRVQLALSMLAAFCTCVGRGLSLAPPLVSWRRPMVSELAAFCGQLVGGVLWSVGHVLGLLSLQRLKLGRGRGQLDERAVDLVRGIGAGVRVGVWVGVGVGVGLGLAVYG